MESVEATKAGLLGAVPKKKAKKLVGPQGSTVDYCKLAQYGVVAVLLFWIGNVIHSVYRVSVAGNQ